MATTYDISTITNDTLNAITFNVTVDAVALDLTGATITMQARATRDTAPVLSLTSVASAGITITNAINGQFKINKQILIVAPGIYLYDIQFLMLSGDVHTYVSGNLTMIGDITHV